MGRTTSGTEHSVLENGGNRCTLSGSRQPAHRAAARHATGRDSAPRPAAVVDLRPSSPNQHTTTTTTAAASQHSLPPARTMNDPTQQREGHMERRYAARVYPALCAPNATSSTRQVRAAEPTHLSRQRSRRRNPRLSAYIALSGGSSSTCPAATTHRRAPFAAHSRATAQSLPSSTQQKHTHTTVVVRATQTATTRQTETKRCGM